MSGSKFWARGRDREQQSETADGGLAGALTAMDRCDRCGAQAYVRALLPNGLELLFCAHHNRSLVRPDEDRRGHPRRDRPARAPGGVADPGATGAGSEPRSVTGFSTSQPTAPVSRSFTRHGSKRLARRTSVCGRPPARSVKWSAMTTRFAGCIGPKASLWSRGTVLSDPGRSAACRTAAPDRCQYGDAGQFAEQLTSAPGDKPVPAGQRHDRSAGRAARLVGEPASAGSFGRA